MSVSIEYSKRFLKILSRVPTDILEKAQERELVFKNDPFDPRLSTHKLHGKERNVWAFSVTFSYRIKFIFIGEKEVLFLEIGTHDIYK